MRRLIASILAVLIIFILAAIVLLPSEEQSSEQKTAPSGAVESLVDAYVSDVAPSTNEIPNNAVPAAELDTLLATLEVEVMVENDIALQSELEETEARAFAKDTANLSIEEIVQRRRELEARERSE
ncbi:MAG: hypothetical protein ABNH53_09025 [Henriciella sp.]|jgi:hypothetical protein